MFTAEIIRDRVRQQPFSPVRIVTSSGQKFDVHHPDLIMVGRNFLEIGTADKHDPSLFETVTRVAVLHVTALQDLPVKRRLGGNGKK